MSKKYYAVRMGRIPGIYEDWETCKKQIHGFPQASYKSFKTYEEAQAFMNLSSSQKTPNLSQDTIAYVDGSYNPDTKKFSYGVVFFLNGEEIHFSKMVDDDDLASMRNVAGEIKGAEAAMSYAIENNCPSLTIYHDYEGISKWCTGEWKATKPGTIAYREYYEKISPNININFVKIKSHSGDQYNELADQLAKNAIFPETKKKMIDKRFLHVYNYNKYLNC